MPNKFAPIVKMNNGYPVIQVPYQHGGYCGTANRQGLRELAVRSWYAITKTGRSPFICSLSPEVDWKQACDYYLHQLSQLNYGEYGTFRDTIDWCMPSAIVGNMNCHQLRLDMLDWLIMYFADI